jgi:pimeloyl-ACP methyl ester carboxylesterase
MSSFEAMRQRFYDRYIDNRHCLIRLTEAQNPFFGELDDNMDGYRAIQTPTLMMAGRRIRAIPLWAQKKICDILPNSRWMEIEGSGARGLSRAARTLLPHHEGLHEGPASRFRGPRSMTVLAHRSAGEGAPLILLNGIAMSMASWEPMAPLLEDEYQVFRCDFRGQLLSKGPPHGDISRHADDVAALMDHLGLCSAHIVSTSFGGARGCDPGSAPPPSGALPGVGGVGGGFRRRHGRGDPPLAGGLRAGRRRRLG